MPPGRAPLREAGASHGGPVFALEGGGHPERAGPVTASLCAQCPGTPEPPASAVLSSLCTQPDSAAPDRGARAAAVPSAGGPAPRMRRRLPALWPCLRRIINSEGAGPAGRTQISRAVAFVLAPQGAKPEPESWVRRLIYEGTPRSRKGRWSQERGS